MFKAGSSLSLTCVEKLSFRLESLKVSDKLSLCLTFTITARSVSPHILCILMETCSDFNVASVWMSWNRKKHGTVHILVIETTDGWMDGNYVPSDQRWEDAGQCVCVCVSLSFYIKPLIILGAAAAGLREDLPLSLLSLVCCFCLNKGQNKNNSLNSILKAFWIFTVEITPLIHTFNLRA